jgi:hypothetical protein
MGRRWLLLAVRGLVLFALAACGVPTDRPWISSVQGPSEPAEKGGPAAFTIKYDNATEAQSFTDVEVVVRYSEYLDFDQKASPFPDEIDERQRELTWWVGTLKPDESGSILVELRLAREIPLEVYELKITAEISIPSEDGGRTGYDRTGRTLIKGHPTPTPRPTDTPLPTSPATPLPRVTAAP